MQKYAIGGCVLVAALATGNAQAAVLFELADGVRAPDTGANTFVVTNGGGSVTLTYSDTPSLTLVPKSNDYNYFVINFPEVSLENVGDKVSVSFAYTPSSASVFRADTGGALRIGLYDAVGTVVSQDSPTAGLDALNNDRGYVAQYGPNATNSPDSIFRQRTGNNNNLFSSGTYQTVTDSPTLDSPGTGSASGVFSIELTNEGIRLTSIINDGTAQTVTDTSGLTTTFSELGVFFHVSSGDHSIEFTDLTVSFVPEPAALSMVGLGAGLLTLRRRRAMAG